MAMTMERSDSTDNQSNRARQAAAGKKRTVQSCVCCKTRKTKCINPVPGPCNYCSRTKQPCILASKKPKKISPASEEDHQHATRILQTLFPGQRVDSQFLRATSENLTNKQAPPPNPAEDMATLTPLTSGVEVGVAEKESIGVFEEQPSEQEESPGMSIDDAGENEKHQPSLTESVGCYLQDSHGQRRYIGLGSDVSFHAAVRSHVERIDSTNQADILPPRPAPLPPITPITTWTFESNSGFPPRHLAEQYICQMLQNIQCCYWFYSSEHLYHQLEHLFSERSFDEMSSSWRCFLLSAFSLGSMISDRRSRNHMETQDSTNDVSVSTAGDSLSSLEYVLGAKSNISALYEEADADTVCALCLLSLALQVHGFTTLSYLHIGAAARIAVTLGWHKENSTMALPQTERERVRKRWCSLYLVDQQISLNSSRPPALAGFSHHMPKVSETVINPGITTPPDFLHVFVTLHQLNQKMRDNFYDRKTSETLSIEELHETASFYIRSHEKFMGSIPLHLQLTHHIPPTYHRSLCILHLHYWYSIISVTRVFLRRLALENVRQASNHLTSQNKSHGDRHNDKNNPTPLKRQAQTCLDAAISSLDILKAMQQRETLSGLITFDTNCVIANIMVFLLAMDTQLEPTSGLLQSKINEAVALLHSIPLGSLCRSKYDEVMTLLRTTKLTTVANDTGSGSVDTIEYTQNINECLDMAFRQFAPIEDSPTELLLNDDLFWNMDV